MCLVSLSVSLSNPVPSLAPSNALVKTYFAKYMYTVAGTTR